MAKETERQRRERLKVKQSKERSKTAQVAPKMVPGYPKTPLIGGSEWEKMNDTDIPRILEFAERTKNINPRTIKRVLEGRYGSGW